MLAVAAVKPVARLYRMSQSMKPDGRISRPERPRTRRGGALERGSEHPLLTRWGVWGAL